MPYLKWWMVETPKQGFVTARLFAGRSFDDNSYCGTVVLPPEIWEKFLDVMIHGAAQLSFDEDSVQIFYGPEDNGDG